MAGPRSGSLVFVLGLSSLNLMAQETPPHAANTASVGPNQPPTTAPARLGTSTNNPPSAETQTNAVLKEIRPGVFEFGDVRIDKQQRTVSFPARLNLSQGPMEYLLVTSWGKIHESILQTETEPDHIHVAMLLLGAKGAPTNSPAAREATGDAAPFNEGRFISRPSKIQLPGDAIALDVSWNVNGKPIRKRAEELVLNRKTKSVMPARTWVYNGSRMLDHIFGAEVDGSIVSLITDLDALINNTGPGHDNDALWTANTNSLPPANLPLEVTIKLNGARPRR